MIDTRSWLVWGVAVALLAGLVTACGAPAPSATDEADVTTAPAAATEGAAPSKDLSSQQPPSRGVLPPTRSRDGRNS